MWWHILQTEATADEKTVKRAYAKILRTIDQDTQIEEFTKLNEAYRMAIKSFKKGFDKDKLFFGEENLMMYERGLEKIYGSPKRRLRLKNWKNLFACMSFKEEEQFGKKHVEYFNQHYFLTDEIWNFIEKYYPLSHQKDFKWNELRNGDFSVTEAEVKEFSEENAIDYVEKKILIYYKILNKSYSLALEMIGEFTEKFYISEDIALYMMICLGELEKMEELKSFYNTAKNQVNSSELLDYYYNGYTKKGNENTDEILPWMELDRLSNKQKKLLIAGDFKKTVHDESSAGKGLLGRLRRR